MSFKVELTINDQESRLTVLDIGYDGTIENPTILVQQGWKRDGPGSYRGTVKRSDYLKALHMSSLDEDEAEEHPLTEALDDLLDASTRVMSALRGV